MLYLVNTKNKKHEATNVVKDKYKQVIYTSTIITFIGYTNNYVTYNVDNNLVDISHISILVVSA